jgi:hypothetical protein
LSNYLGLEGAIRIPHTHHCGGAVRVLPEGTVNHLQVCPVLGRNSAPRDAGRDVLSHLVVQNGVTDAAVVETRLATADGRTYDADMVYFDPSSRAGVPTGPGRAGPGQFPEQARPASGRAGPYFFAGPAGPGPRRAY